MGKYTWTQVRPCHTDQFAGTAQFSKPPGTKETGGIYSKSQIISYIDQYLRGTGEQEVWELGEIENNSKHFVTFRNHGNGTKQQEPLQKEVREKVQEEGGADPPVP